MTIKNCIDDAVKAGEMDPVRAKEAKELFDRIEADLRPKHGAAAAEIRAGEQTVEQIRFETAKRKHQSLKQASAQSNIMRGMEDFKTLKGHEDISEAAIGIWDSVGLEGLTYRSAQQNRNVVQGRAHGMLSEVLAAFRRNLAGNTRDKATLLDVVREAFGHDTGNANAKALSKAWYESAEFLRKQFNEAGGFLPKLERWGMPQMHDAAKIGKVSMDEWRGFIRSRLDLEKTVDARTGKAFTESELDEVLAEVYQTLRTGGMSKMEPSGISRSKMLGNSRADSRFLHFKTADDWLSYQDKFGVGDVWSSMMAHVDAMSRDIGIMQTMGPNPAATMRLVQQTMQKQAAETTNDVVSNRLKSIASHLPNLFDQYTGAANAPTNATVSRWLGTLRGVLTSAQLGSAQLAAIADIGFGRMAAATSGLSQARLLSRHLKLLNPLNMEDQKRAIRLGLIADNWSQVASAQMRYVGEVAGTEVSRRLSDAVLRVSGLSPWTQAGKWAFGMEFMGTLADHAGRGFGDLPPPLRKTLINNNIDEAAWNVIRKTDIYEPDAGGFIRPDDILDEELGIRVLAMIQQETDFAVPSTSLRGRAALTGNIRPGNIPGELLRSATMYKSFAVTMYFTHLRRMASQQGFWGKGGKASYGVQLMISATLMGALSTQLKEISKGKDPRPMFGKHAVEFWIAAAAQGGGLGIFGDFAFSDVNRFGGGIQQTIAGPVIGFGNDLLKLTAGNLHELVKGQETHFGREVVNMAKRNAPGTSIWYARAAFERLFFDQIESMVDPGARNRYRRIERKHNRETGNQYYWNRGDLSPDRAPDIGSAFE